MLLAADWQVAPCMVTSLSTSTQRQFVMSGKDTYTRTTDGGRRTSPVHLICQQGLRETVCHLLANQQ